MLRRMIAAVNLQTLTVSELLHNFERRVVCVVCNATLLNPKLEYIHVVELLAGESPLTALYIEDR